MSTITDTQETAIREWIAAHPTLAVGLGTAEQACSVAAINLALSGQLTARVPDCMSRVIGRWIIGVQDRMPANIRNSADWRDLLPLAAGTGRAHEAERMAIVMGWMWGTALPMAQPVADAHRCGAEWRAMCTQRTRDAAYAAAAAAAAYAAAAYAAYAYAAARAAANAAAAADAAWATLDPVVLLRRLIAVTDARVQP
jgi:hypothetical protein